MLTSFRILSLAWLAVSVLGQDCVDVTLDCNQPVPTIFKLGNASCACNRPEHAGALKYDSGKVHVCLGNEWKVIQFEESYGSETNPGYSCEDILNKAGKQLNDGVYWIRLPGIKIVSTLSKKRCHEIYQNSNGGNRHQTEWNINKLRRLKRNKKWKTKLIQLQKEARMVKREDGWNGVQLWVLKTC